jgi:hypothetical protein
MIGLFRWLRRANAAARKRAEIVLAARGILDDMDQTWRPEADMPRDSDGVALLLMRIGLVHLQAVYQGQMAAQNLLRAGKARLN